MKSEKPTLGCVSLLKVPETAFTRISGTTEDHDQTPYKAVIVRTKILRISTFLQ